MNKKLLTLAVAVAMAAPVAAMAEATMYGKVRQAVDYVSDDNTNDEWRVTDYASRIGVKGSEDLGGGLKAVYKMEWGVQISNGNDGNGNEFQTATDQALTNRNAYVGLAGDWGTFLAGRHDTPLKISTATLDYFSDQAGDYNLTANGGFQDRRADGTAAYISPNMAGFTLAAAIIPGENANADGMTDAYSLAAMYSNSGFFASGAYEAGNNDIDALGAGGPNSADLEQYRFGLGYDGGEWKVGFVYENMQLDFAAPGVKNWEQDRYMLNGAYNFGNNTIKAKYFDADNTVDGWAIGFDHNFSKRTQFQATYVASAWDDKVGGGDTDVFSLQLNHEF